MSVKTATLNDILATRSKMVWAHRINFDSLGLGDIDEMKSWCEKNCKDVWRCEQYYALYFQFSDDKDATMFMLKFGGKAAK
jgi:hypothetical protein